MNIKVKTIMLFLLVGLLAACGPPCTQKGYRELIPDFESRIVGALEMFIDQESLSGTITNLEGLLRDSEDMKIPSCYQDIHEEFNKALSYFIMGIKGIETGRSEAFVSEMSWLFEYSNERGFEMLRELPEE